MNVIIEPCGGTYPDYPGPKGDIISLLDHLLAVKRINIVKLSYGSFSLAEYFRDIQPTLNDG